MMDSYPDTSDAQPSEGNPAFSAGLEAGLVGAVLILIEQLLQNFIQVPGLDLVLGFLRVCIWIGVGGLAVYWLKGKGSLDRPDQTKAGLIAGLLTALVTTVLLIVFRYMESKSMGEIPIPEGIPVDLYPEFIDLYNQYFGLAFAISMVCCIGLPTIIIATAFSFGGTVLMRMFLGSSTQPSDEQQPSFASYPDKSVSREALPQQEIQPRRLRDFLSVGGLPIELQPSAAAFQRGELDIARPAFVRFLRQSPKHAYAWLWLSVMIDDRDRQLECIRRALALEPENETAKKMLVFLEKSPTN